MKRIPVLTTAVAVTAIALPVPMAGAKTDEVTFNHAANGACQWFEAQSTKIGTASDAKDLNRQLSQQLKLADQLTAKLAKIEAPAARKAGYRKYRSLLSRSNALVAQGIGAAKSHQVNRSADLLYRGVKLAQQAGAEATDLDLGSCVTNYYPGVGGSSTDGTVATPTG